MNARFLLVLLALLFGGCVSQRVTRERAAYLRDPGIPRHAYDGSAVGGAHYRYLIEHDSAFGDYLLSIVPTSSDAVSLKLR